MERKLANFGILSPSSCNGTKISSGLHRKVYDALKAEGFVETRWQFIFEGQQGGIVYPFRDGLNEIHVRFYSDRIFAELELSRSSPLHFLFPLYQANAQIEEMLQKTLSQNELRELHIFMTTNLRSQEKQLGMWHGSLQSCERSGILNRGRRLERTLSLLQRIFSWQSLPPLLFGTLLVTADKLPTALAASMFLLSFAFACILLPHSRRP